MRVKKQKINRRTVRFYKTCCGFREPFKVLCDGTFLHFTLNHKMGSPNEQLSRLLSAPARPFITRCVIAELKKLGESSSGALLAARRLDSAKCNHEPLKSAPECLEGLVKDGNPEHFFVATQDADLRKKLRQIPGVAIILAQNNFLVLEPPSEKQQDFARASEAERAHVKDREYKIIEARERKKAAHLVAEENVGEAMRFGSNTPLMTQNTNLGVELGSGKKGNNLGVKDRPQFKRKRAKGPNPLSCKKKTNKSTTLGKVAQRAAAVDGEAKARSGNRKRRHRRKSSMEGDAG